MKPRFLAPALVAISLGACSDHPESSTSEVDALTDPIETLWVADQITGFLGKWVRNQQRYLISDSTLSCQGFYLEMGGGIVAEFYSAEYPIVSHRRNEHGGVIAYRQAPGDLLTITQEMDEEGERFVAPQRSAERFEAEEGAPNSLLAYRWIDGGRVDLLDLYPEEGDSEGTWKAIDADEVLASLADPAAFSALRWIDEESLLPGDPPFVNLAELRRSEETLKDFPDNEDAAFAEVSKALDRNWKAAESEPSPKHLGGIGVFTSARRFALVFPEAMRESGFHPILGAFSFARAQDRSHFEGELSEDDQRTVEMLQARYEPYAEFFEGSLGRLVDSPDPVRSLPGFVREQDWEQSGATEGSEAEDRPEEASKEDPLPIPPPPLSGRPDYGSGDTLKIE